MDPKKKSTIKFPKTILFVLVIFVYFYLLPPIVTTASLYYFKDWQQNAEKSAITIADSQPYCIMVYLDGAGWYVPENFSALDIKQIIKKEVEWKFNHFDFSLGNKSNTLRVREVHFGILLNKKLYYWSFMKQAFFDAKAHGYADVTFRLLSETRHSLTQSSQQYYDRRLKNIQKNYPQLIPEDFICPHI